MKKDIVIHVENLSKQYRLGQVGTGTISHDLNRWWSRIRGKEDPYLKIGETNDRTKAGNSDYVWSLKDINFDVNRGEALGIIGKNGAGKSTLLKILSQVTKPTTGAIKAKGRIASLLEVGTGFHPDLSGRDNIFLNGAILGMTKLEIKRKFDEIVDFSGVERYIDTPVKRYSSGMYVRLAFAVAAYLESEILIVDEVLAVGDAEFQKKCLGKMKDVSSGEGRTVLFVSHNMAAIKELCTRLIVLKNGALEIDSTVRSGIDLYLFDSKKSNIYNKEASITSSFDNYIKSCYTYSSIFEPKSQFDFSEEIKIQIEIVSTTLTGFITLGLAIKDNYGTKIFTTTNQVNLTNNLIKYSVIVPKKTLLTGEYKIDIAMFIPNGIVYDYVADEVSFSVYDLDSELAIYGNADVGRVLIKCLWEEN